MQGGPSPGPSSSRARPAGGCAGGCRASGSRTSDAPRPCATPMQTPSHARTTRSKSWRKRRTSSMDRAPSRDLSYFANAVCKLSGLRVGGPRVMIIVLYCNRELCRLATGSDLCVGARHCVVGHPGPVAWSVSCRWLKGGRDRSRQSQARRTLQCSLHNACKNELARLGLPVLGACRQIGTCRWSGPCSAWDTVAGVAPGVPRRHPPHFKPQPQFKRRRSHRAINMRNPVSNLKFHGRRVSRSVAGQQARLDSLRPAALGWGRQTPLAWEGRSPS